MIYNTRNPSNDTIESQKEKKTFFNAHFQYNQSKITSLNKIWSLKSLAMLKCESRTSLHAVQISNSQTLFCFVLIILRMAIAQALCSYILWESKSGFALRLFLIFLLLPKSRLLSLKNCSYKRRVQNKNGLGGKLLKT